MAPSLLPGVLAIHLSLPGTKVGAMIESARLADLPAARSRQTCATRGWSGAEDVVIQVAELEEEIYQAKIEELRRLPEKFGYSSMEDLIVDLRAVSGARRSRTDVTPELESRVVAALQSGSTGPEVVREFGISTTTVQNIREKHGLIGRKKRAAGA